MTQPYVVDDPTATSASRHYVGDRRQDLARDQRQIRTAARVMTCGKVKQRPGKARECGVTTRTVENHVNVPAAASDVWDRAVNPDGINFEMRPWMTMSMPPGAAGLSVEDIPPWTTRRPRLAPAVRPHPFRLRPPDYCRARVGPAVPGAVHDVEHAVLGARADVDAGRRRYAGARPRDLSAAPADPGPRRPLGARGRCLLQASTPPVAGVLRQVTIEGVATHAKRQIRTFGSPPGQPARSPASVPSCQSDARSSAYTFGSPCDQSASRSWLIRATYCARSKARSRSPGQSCPGS